MENVNSLSEWTASQFDPTLSWKDVEWVRKLWPGKLILKGILDPEDAKRAAKTGADAIIVSNHGGRQLDGTSSSISMLPKVADAVGSDIEIMFDGGIRTGPDMLRALALGAKSCMIGRAYIWGLGAGGQEGVAKAIDILRKELDVNMALCGVKNVRDIDRSIVQSEDAPAKPKTRAQALMHGNRARQNRTGERPIAISRTSPRGGWTTTPMATSTTWSITRISTQW